MSNKKTSSPPKFVVHPKASEVKFDQGTREIFNFKDVSDLSALDDRTYYIHDAANFALSDSFMVEFGARRLGHGQQRCGCVQVTKSRLHRGSVKGFLHVRKLVSILKNQLKEGQPPSKTAKVTFGQTPSRPVVDVRYVLVVPETAESSEQKREWQFPIGWDEDYRVDDLRGEVFCLELSRGNPEIY
jgi:hypothetical protein